MNRWRIVSLVAWLGVLTSSSLAYAQQQLCFDVTLDAKAAAQPITGRLFVLLTQNGKIEPRLGPSWFQPEPFYAADVVEFKPGETRRIDDAAEGFPGKLSSLKPGRYRVQSVLDHSFYEQHH